MNTSWGHREGFLLNQLDIAVLIALNCLIYSSFPGVTACLTGTSDTQRNACLWEVISGLWQDERGKLFGTEELLHTLQIPWQKGLCISPIFHLRLSPEEDWGPFQGNKSNLEWNLPVSVLCLLELSLFSLVQPFTTPWTITLQVPLAMVLSWQEYWSSWHFLLQGIFQTQRSNSCLLLWQADSLPLSHTRVTQNPSVTQKAQQSTIDLGSVHQTYSTGIIHQP